MAKTQVRERKKKDGPAAAQDAAKEDQAEDTAPDTAEDDISKPETFRDKLFRLPMESPILAGTISVVTVMFIANVLKAAYQTADLQLGLMGRPRMPLDVERQFLVVGTMGSGTAQKVSEFIDLGLEVRHESSLSTELPCREGTVSWAHGVRFIDPALVDFDRLCSKPRFGAWHSTMYTSGRQCKRSTTEWWSECWEEECKRVAQREVGCGLEGAPEPCITPFSKTLLQVRNPLRVIGTLIAAFCNGTDTEEAAQQSMQADTFDVLLPPPPPPPGAAGGGEGECRRRFGWYWVQYNKAVLPHVDGVYRVEYSTPCSVLHQAGVTSLYLPPGDQEAGHSEPAVPTPPESTVPAAVARRVQKRCAEEEAAGLIARDGEPTGHVNRRNVGAKYTEVTMSQLREVDAALAEEVEQLGQQLGYWLKEEV